jgi:drug/metabolite transporter (DMT)-like permease
VQPHPSASAYAALAGTTVFFGLSFVATKVALQGFEPLLVALIRFALAGGILWLAWRLFGGAERASRAELGRLAVLGLVSLTIYFSLENTGIARTSASEAAILIAAIPIFVVVLNLFTLREHVSARQWSGIILSFAGIIGLVQFAAGSDGGSLIGNLLVLGASLAAAVYTLMARHLLVKRSALYVTTYQHLFGALFILPVAAIEFVVAGARQPTWPAAGGLLYLTILCSVVGYLLLNYAFRFVEASKVSVFINLTPVVGVAGAFALLGERFTLGQAVAAAVVVLGVWLTNSARSAPAAPATA